MDTLTKIVRELFAEMSSGANGTNFTIGVNCFSTVTEMRLLLFALGVQLVTSVCAVESVQYVCGFSGLDGFDGSGPSLWLMVMVLNAPTKPTFCAAARIPSQS